ncbi:hypothetical protein [Actinophytocola xanthii]|uniref:Uncharacterized protein n=1 Tax=Actinophytocola xanthii TaxID=1912961 RepID=A0A1Q8BTV3_9PSEU|nr:hypothetical protein [Actinophytocola xanthii]OLF05528.1 hypothetical protein BU204_37080 [Actinophytocola xanthii]
MNGDDQDVGRDAADVKRWLGSALAGEPPMELDRSEVVRQGRRGLRRRRALEAGAAAVAVVVTAVGAVLLTAQSGGDEPSLPPATRPTTEITAPSAPGNSPPSTSTGTPPVPPSSVRPETTIDPQATALTETLERSGLLTELGLTEVEGESVPARFTPNSEGYHLQGAVPEGAAAGILTVSVSRTTVTQLSCDLVERPYFRCDVQQFGGIPLAIAKYDPGAAGFQQQVVALRPEGVLVEAHWMVGVPNASGRQPQPHPAVFDQLKLAKVVTLPGLTLP